MHVSGHNIVESEHLFMPFWCTTQVSGHSVVFDRKSACHVSKHASCVFIRFVIWCYPNQIYIPKHVVNKHEKALSTDVVHTIFGGQTYGGTFYNIDNTEPVTKRCRVACCLSVTTSNLPINNVSSSIILTLYLVSIVGWPNFHSKSHV